MSRRAVAAVLINNTRAHHLHLLVQLLLLQLLPTCCRTRTMYDSESIALRWQQQQPLSAPIEPIIDAHEYAGSGFVHLPQQKRRLVVKIPFAQNPEMTHLSRIYKSLFTQKEKKKLNQAAAGSIILRGV